MHNKKLILHIGYSKCGSTTIQDTLAANHEILLDNGILFPRIHAENSSWMRFFWEKKLSPIYDRDTVDQKFRDFLQGLRHELEREAIETVILSDEGLISLAEDSVREMKAFFEREFRDYHIEVIALVREPVSFFTSRIQQFISNRYFDKEAIADFLEGLDILNGESRADSDAMNPATFFSKPISIFDEIYGKIDILQFEEAIRDEVGLTHCFLQSCGHDIKLSDVRQNESRSDKAIDIMAYINGKLPFSDPVNGRQFRYYDDLAPLYSVSGEKFSLSAAVRAQIRATSSGEVDWLQNRCGIDYHTGPVNEVDQAIIWDYKFVRDIQAIYPSIQPLHRILILSFLRDLRSKDLDEISEGCIGNLLAWIEDEDPYLTKLSVEQIKSWLLFRLKIRAMARDEQSALGCSLKVIKKFTKILR